MTRRYLDLDQKERALAEWGRCREAIPPAGDLAGRGWPDQEIVPLCDALNSLPGVCTLQSCSGHDGNGHLWLWLDEQMSLEFDRWGYVLARMSGVEVVSRKYTSWGQEITAIEFDGRFKEACESVSIFFSALVANCNSPPSPSPCIRCPTRQS